MNLTEFIAGQNKVTLVATGVALLVAVVLADLASGPEFETSVFYLIPVSFFAAFLGRRTGLVVSVVCAAVARPIHQANFPYIRSGMAYWNALAWLAVYVFFVLMISEIRDLYQRERAWAHTDSLTGIPNRRAFFERLEIEKNRARRYERPLTLAYLDLDHFKEVNDTLGHETGDQLLGIVANVMTRGIRQADAVARLGGDEFAIVLPETNKSAAAAALNKVSSSLDAAMKERNWPVTFSIGLVTFQPTPDSTQEIISAADQAMYAAKKSGRGRVVMRPAG
jgi:diguanylate cyclase (GGDEF)-like protein